MYSSLYYIHDTLDFMPMHGSISYSIIKYINPDSFMMDIMPDIVKLSSLPPA